MADYIKLGILLNFLVNFMLLMAVGRMTVAAPGVLRLLLGSAVGSGYTGACFLPQMSFLSHSIWYLLSLWLTGSIAFGLSRRSVRRCALYCLLQLALNTLAGGSLQAGDLLWIGLLCIGCILIFRMDATTVPVELSYGGRHIQLRALYDTGNTLRDPITGRGVLVVGADVARQLTGLSPQQLSRPVQTMGALPGLQLIPYRTVDRASGFLLAVQVKEGKIAGKRGSCLVAMAPRELEGNYQGLIGGAV